MEPPNCPQHATPVVIPLSCEVCLLFLCSKWVKGMCFGIHTYHQDESSMTASTVAGKAAENRMGFSQKPPWIQWIGGDVPAMLDDRSSNNSLKSVKNSHHFGESPLPYPSPHEIAAAEITSQKPP